MTGSGEKPETESRVGPTVCEYLEEYGGGWASQTDWEGAACVKEENQEQVIPQRPERREGLW
jgi:hypothetical protein